MIDKIIAFITNISAKKLGIVLAALLIVAALFLYFAPGKAHTQSYFECAPNNTLVVCPIGETPDSPPHLECVAVGSGASTIGTGTCS